VSPHDPCPLDHPSEGGSLRVRVPDDRFLPQDHFIGVIFQPVAYTHRWDLVPSTCSPSTVLSDLPPFTVFLDNNQFSFFFPQTPPFSHDCSSNFLRHRLELWAVLAFFVPPSSLFLFRVPSSFFATIPLVFLFPPPPPFLFTVRSCVDFPHFILLFHHHALFPPFSVLRTKRGLGGVQGLFFFFFPRRCVKHTLYPVLDLPPSSVQFQPT